MLASPKNLSECQEAGGRLSWGRDSMVSNKSSKTLLETISFDPDNLYNSINCMWTSANSREKSAQCHFHHKCVSLSERVLNRYFNSILGSIGLKR